MSPLPKDFDYKNGGQADRKGVLDREICNSAGFCMFGSSVTPPDAFHRLIEAATGFTYSPEEYDALGVRMYYMRHLFNVREGMNRKSFTFSKRFTQSPPPTTGPLKDADVPVETMADSFFDAMHLDRESLIPEKEYLESLGGLEFTEADLY